MMCKTYQHVKQFKLYSGGIVVRILHHVHQVHDDRIFAAVRLFGGRGSIGSTGT